MKTVDEILSALACQPPHEDCRGGGDIEGFDRALSRVLSRAGCRRPPPPARGRAPRFPSNHRGQGRQGNRPASHPGRHAPPPRPPRSPQPPGRAETQAAQAQSAPPGPPSPLPPPGRRRRRAGRPTASSEITILRNAEECRRAGDGARDCGRCRSGRGRRAAPPSSPRPPARPAPTGAGGTSGTTATIPPWWTVPEILSSSGGSTHR